VRVAVVDHGMGNLRSVAKAFEAAGAQVRVTAERREIAASDAMCVPGQGVFDRCMSNLADLDLLDEVAGWIAQERPYLGICLGMQVLFDESEERGPVPGLSILEGKVVKLPNSVTVPHIGWNTVGGRYFYFDHSYAAIPSDGSVVAGWCQHGSRFAAHVESGVVTGVQFHPEKSGREGIALLERWMAR
jgi:imidazole glycerol phosphate synthase glutamine amidotransferase subunit